MRILMLGNSFIFTHDVPGLLAGLTGAEVVSHTRGGARLAEQLNPNAKLGAKTLAALQNERWDYVVLQEMSNGAITAPERFFSSVRRLCGLARDAGAVPVLYSTWAYRPDCPRLAKLGMGAEEMYAALSAAYERAARENGALLAEAGRRFFELGHSGALYEPDGEHPSELGARIAADAIALPILRHAAGRAEALNPEASV